MSGTCGTMAGGRRRKSKKTRASRKMKGGVMYGPGAAIAPGALEWGGVDTSAPYDSATGTKMADPFGTSPDTNAKVTGGKRRSRASRKGGKKTRKTKKAGRRHKKMKGGGFDPLTVNSGSVGYGFAGAQQGVTGGIAPAAGYAAKMGGAPMGSDGVRHA